MRLFVGSSAEASGSSRGAAAVFLVVSAPDDNVEVEVVGRVGRARAAGRCGIDARGRLHALRAMAEPVERASAMDRCRRSPMVGEATFVFDRFL